MNNQFSFKRAGIKMPKKSNKLYRKYKQQKMEIIPENNIIGVNKKVIIKKEIHEDIIKYDLTNAEKNLINQYWPNTYTPKSLATILKNKEDFYILNKNWFEFNNNYQIN